jgi:uncharacterized protein (DUF1778 family)
MTGAASGKESGSPTISLRVPRQRRELIDRAASATGKTRTEFILDSATRAAEEALLRAERLELSARDSRRVLELLENPPAPTPALRKAVADKYGH